MGGSLSLGLLRWIVRENYGSLDLVHLAAFAIAQAPFADVSGIREDLDELNVEPVVAVSPGQIVRIVELAGGGLVVLRHGQLVATQCVHGRMQLDV